METHRRSKTSPAASDMFTFPEMSPDVKFGSELADQLFANGKLLHHHFPAEQNNFTIPKSLILSRTSSISSKGSLMSSRSTSTNSRSSSNSNSSSNSSCNSARTSTSDMSPMKKLSMTNQGAKPLAAIKGSSASGRFNDYGHSQRWQFIAPVPVLNRRNSSRKKKGTKRKVKRQRVVRKGLCRRFFGWIVSTCQECHAIEPTKRVKVSM